MGKLLEVVLKVLLIPLLKDLFNYLRKKYASKKEKIQRHKDNKIKVESYGQSNSSSASVDFDKLP